MLEEIKFNHHMLQYYADRFSEQLEMQLPDDVQSVVYQLDYPNISKLESNHLDNNVPDGGYVTSDHDYEDEEINDPKSGVEHTQIRKDESINSCYGNKTVTLEIGEILAKIKGQITFKKLGSDKPAEQEEGPKKTINNSETKSLNMNGKTTKAAGTASKNGTSKSVSNEKSRYYKCFLCNSTFTGERELLRHSRKQCMEPGNTPTKPVIILDDNGQKEVCDQCGKVVACNYLKKHKQLHAKTQKRCPICDQFIKKTSYDRHVQAHSGLPKMRQCPHCDYETKYGEGLDAHINKKHLFIRPYACDTCGKSFHSKLLLREHVRIHTRLLSEQCDICGDRFLYKKSLVLHMRIHTGYAPYKCDLCDKSFISASRRQVHKQTKHSSRSFQCEICTKKFFLRSTLRTHQIKQHETKRNSENTNDVD